MGVTRRAAATSRIRRCRSGSMIAAFGAVLIALGIASLPHPARRQLPAAATQLRDTTGDPWDGRTLEWSTSSPPPAYNFAFTPVVHDLDAWCDMKKRGYERPLEGFRPIHMPKNTGAGFILAVLSAVCGFALIWYIWWLAALRFVAHARRRDRPHLQLRARLPHPGGRGRPHRRTRAPACWPAMSESTAPSTHRPPTAPTAPRLLRSRRARITPRAARCSASGST